VIARTCRYRPYMAPPERTSPASRPLRDRPGRFIPPCVSIRYARGCRAEPSGKLARARP